MKILKLLSFIFLFPIFIQAQVDVSLRKTLASGSPFLYGDQVTFNIELTNNGIASVQNIVIRDILPCGFDYSGGSQPWVLSGIDRETTLAGPLAAGQSATVSISLILKACLLPDAWMNTAQITRFENLSGANIITSDSNSGNNIDTAIADVFDLALRKTLTTAAPYSYGDLLTFDITIYNQGNQIVKDISIKDHLPFGVGYMYNPIDNPGWMGMPTTINTTIAGPLAPGSSTSVQLKLILLKTSGGESSWANYAEISSAQDQSSGTIFDSDSTPNSNSISELGVLPGSANDNNIAGGGLNAMPPEDEDDHDVAGASVFDLALTKTQGSALLSFSYLQEVEYVFTIVNQGSMPSTNIIVTDYLSTALNYMPTPKNILRGWVYNGMSNTATLTYSKVLLPGDSDTIKLDLMPIQFYVDPDNAWTDYAEISGADDTDPMTILAPVDLDSNSDIINGNDAGGQANSPSDGAIDGDGSGVVGDAVAATDEDDHDPHKIQIFDLALRKTIFSPGQFFSIGDDVIFDITVFNQGNVAAKNIIIADYIPAGFGFIPGGANTGWSGAAPLVKKTLAAALLPGTSTATQITLRVQSSMLPDAYLNYSEVSAAQDLVNNNRNDDADSVPDDVAGNDNPAQPGSADDDNLLGNSNILEDQDDHDVAGIELLCERPTLTVGIPVCEPGNNTYSVTYYSNVTIGNITSSIGTVSGSKIINIPLASNVVITAANGPNCTQSLTVITPGTCPPTGGCTYPGLTVGQPLCNGQTYSVSFTNDLGVVSTTSGTIIGNSIINILIGTDITVTATNGGCVVNINVNSPTNCGIPCANSPISISGPVCEPDGSGNYKVNYIITAGSTVTASVGVLNTVTGMVTGIPSGTNLVLTVTTPGCITRVITVPAGMCAVCERPTLTVGIPVCEPGNNTYSVTYYSNVTIGNITSSIGTVSGSKIINIPLASNVVITAANGPNCTQSLTVITPGTCPPTGGCTYPGLTVGQPLCNGQTYSVSFTNDLGVVSTTSGTIIGNSIINILIGTDITVTATNGGCVVNINVNSPTNCGIPCANSPISISGPVCEPDGSGNYKVNYIIAAGSTVTASVGVLNTVTGMVTGIPSGTNLVLTVTTPGCITRVITVPAGMCAVCERPTLTVGIPVCEPGNNTYSVTYYSNVTIGNITSSIGTVSGSKIINIPLASNVVITAANGPNCTQSLTVITPGTCPPTGGCTYPGLTVGQPLCNGQTYSVSFTNDLGVVSTTSGTINGNSIINILIGTDITVTATNGGCVVNVEVDSPTNCSIPCANSPISISGPVCEADGSGNYKVNYIMAPGSTVIASVGILNTLTGMVTGIPSGTNLVLTVTTPGCITRVITVPAGICTSGNGSLGNFVWFDKNGDGQQNGGEPGIPGVLVMLMDQNNMMIAQTTTAANGSYTITMIPPGTYYVKFTTPDGFEPTFPDLGNDNSDSDANGSQGPGTTSLITLGSNQNVTSIDAGFYKCVPIGDLVWYDVNKNDKWDSNENGINGLRVNLWRNHFGTWIIWEYKYTGHKPGTPSDDGYFKFCSPPGQYYIEVIMPPLGLVRAIANVGNSEEIDSDIDNSNGVGTSGKFTVRSDDMKCDLGAGYYPQAVAGNLVWRDDNLNGIQDTGEARISGVLVEAVEVATGAVLRSDVTNSEGIYNLDYLEKKDIYLKFSPPAGYGATVYGASNDDAMDSDVDHSFGLNTTRMFSMQPSMVNENIDMGIAFGVLPVQWLDVAVRRENKSHLITWKTAKEVNVSHYEVERKFGNATTFISIPGIIKAKGNTLTSSQYIIEDNDVNENGIYIYRVKQIDFDGQFTFSKQVKVHNSAKSSIDIYPNPAKSETNIEVVLEKDSEVKIELMDAASKVIKVIQNPGIISSGQMIYPVNLDDLAPGMYSIIINIDGKITQKKLIKVE